MPHHFDKFRLLNHGSRIRNESDQVAFLRMDDQSPPIELPPGGEVDIPYAPNGEALLEVPHDTP